LLNAQDLLCPVSQISLATLYLFSFLFQYVHSSSEDPRIRRRWWAARWSSSAASEAIPCLMSCGDALPPAAICHCVSFLGFIQLQLTGNGRAAMLALLLGQLFTHAQAAISNEIKAFCLPMAQVESRVRYTQHCGQKNRKQNKKLVYAVALASGFSCCQLAAFTECTGRYFQRWYNI